MRQLTVKQKKMLKDWFNKNYKGGYMFDLAEKIDYKTYCKIEAIHPTEIFYQNVNSFLEELASEYKK